MSVAQNVLDTIALGAFLIVALSLYALMGVARWFGRRPDFERQLEHR